MSMATMVKRKRQTDDTAHWEGHYVYWIADREPVFGLVLWVVGEVCWDGFRWHWHGEPIIDVMGWTDDAKCDPSQGKHAEIPKREDAERTNQMPLFKMAVALFSAVESEARAEAKAELLQEWNQ